MKTYVCPVCGYVHEGDAPPEKCPQCGVPGSKFIEKETGDKLVFACEHELGIAKAVTDTEILDGLRANFSGECTEVGMYLAMARVAYREGYAEIGAYWEKAAYEEAEHAAKFAELLGEVLSSSTKENLEKRVAAEHGATEGKLRSSILMLSMTQFMKWLRTRLVTARLLKDFSRDISADIYTFKR